VASSNLRNASGPSTHSGSGLTGFVFICPFPYHNDTLHHMITEH
jgi:hypothetical protein